MVTKTLTTLYSEKFQYSNDKVRVIGVEDYKAAALTLAEAFYDDDVAFYFLDVPDNGGKTREDLWPLHLEILEYIVLAHVYNGLVLSVGEHHEGVALWYVNQYFLHALSRFRHRGTAGMHQTLLDFPNVTNIISAL